MKKLMKQIGYKMTVLTLLFALVACSGGGTKPVIESEDVDPPVTEQQTTESTTEEVGDVNPDGVFNETELLEKYNTIKAAYDAGDLRGMLYTEVVETYFDGQEGVLDMEGETITVYLWYAKDRADSYVQVSFQDYGEGERTAGGIGSYFP